MTLKVFSGSSNEPLAMGIAKYMGKPLGKIKIQKFMDGEIGVQILENVRGADVYLVQSTCTPVNDNIMEALLIVDALKRASAKSITLINPYYGYARQDRKTKARVPISAAMVAILYEAAGVQKVMGVDLHCGQIQGFFRIPVDNLTAKTCLIQHTLKKVKDLKNICVVSPDAGGAERAYAFKKGIAFEDQELKVSMAMMNKHREKANKVSTMELVGTVKDLDCIIIDDMIDTAGTLCKAAQVLKENGAKRIFCCASHGLFNGPALKRIEESQLDKVIITNSVHHDINEVQKITKKVEIVSLAKILGETIRRVHHGESVSNLFRLEHEK